MLTRIHIENLKCFEKVSLPVAPLTLLTGFNAAGKSTALQPLLLLGQAMRSGGQTALLSLNGPLAKLGTVAEVLNERAAEKRRVIVIGVEIEGAVATWTLAADERGGTNLVVQDLSVRTGSESLSWSDLNSLVPSEEVSPEIHSLFEAMRSVVFLSAVRAGSSDSFPSPETAEPIHADVGIEGEFAPWWFERHLDEDVDSARRHAGEVAPTLRRQLNAWAGDLFPGADANAQKIAYTSLIRLELRTRTTEAYRRPANIGYGLTYAFPLLVALLLARTGQVVVVDSPEAHLHPSAQSIMGRILAHFAAAGVQILAETHSDHVLNGVRLAVSKGSIQPRSVAVHFFNPVPERTDGPAHIVSPFFDTRGNLSEWPTGFFDQSDRDLAALAGWS